MRRAFIFYSCLVLSGFGPFDSNSRSGPIGLHSLCCKCAYLDLGLGINVSYLMELQQNDKTSNELLRLLLFRIQVVKDSILLFHFITIIVNLREMPDNNMR